MQKMIDKEKGGFQLASWDWAFYSEKVRQARYAFDESEIKPYFEINHVLHRRRLLCRDPALRDHLQGTARPAGLSARCPRLRRFRQGRQTARDFSRRLLRAPLKDAAAPG